MRDFTEECIEIAQNEFFNKPKSKTSSYNNGLAQGGNYNLRIRTKE